MPDRVYMSRHHPPRLSDRVGAHWFEISMILYAISRGALTLLDSHFSFVTPPTARLPYFLGEGVSVLLIIGGILWLLAIANRFETINRYYLVLRTGIAMSAIAWMSYFVSSIAFTPRAANMWTVALSFSIASIGLWIQSFSNERTIRKRRACG